MAIDRNTRYPGRFDAPTAARPQGAFKNRSAPGAKDGSYLERDWANDWDGFFGSLLRAAGMNLNGVPDTALSSQYFDALKMLGLRQATESTLGITRISSNALAIAGEDDLTSMTPLKTKAAIVDDKTHVKGESCSYAGFLSGALGVPYLRHFPSDTLVGLATSSSLAALLPKRSFFTNDFIRIPDEPGGLVVQFGVTGSVTGSGGSIFQSFPTPFPSQVNIVLISLNTASGDSTSTPSWVRDKNLNGFTPVNQNVLPATFSWIAIGN